MGITYTLTANQHPPYFARLTFKGRLGNLPSGSTFGVTSIFICQKASCLAGSNCKLSTMTDRTVSVSYRVSDCWVLTRKNRQTEFQLSEFNSPASPSINQTSKLMSASTYKQALPPPKNDNLSRKSSARQKQLLSEQ